MYFTVTPHSHSPKRLFFAELMLVPNLQECKDTEFMHFLSVSTIDYCCFSEWFSLGLFLGSTIFWLTLLLEILFHVSFLHLRSYRLVWTVSMWKLLFLCGCSFSMFGLLTCEYFCDTFECHEMVRDIKCPVRKDMDYEHYNACNERIKHQETIGLLLATTIWGCLVRLFPWTYKSS